MKVTRADWAATAPWDGITGKPDFPGGVTDIGQLTAEGFEVGQVPLWNGHNFVGYTIPAAPTPTPVSQFTPVRVPGFAMRRQQSGNPYGPTADVFDRSYYDLRMFGALGDGVNSDLDAFNRIIDLVNAGGGGLIFAPPGDYLLGELNPITAPFSILGSGMGLTTFRTTNSPWLRAIGPWSNLQAFTLVNDGSGAAETPITVSDGSGGALALLSNIEFVGNWGTVAELRNLDGGLVTNCRFIAGDIGVRQFGCDSVDVVDNYFESLSTWAVYLTDGSGGNCTNARVFNHYVDCPDPAVFGDETDNEIGYFVATTSKLGMVKVGTGLGVDPDGTIFTDGSGGGGSVFSGAKVVRTTNQSIGNASDTLVSWQASDFDSGAYWSAGSPTKLTISETGYYHLSTSISFAANSNGIRALTVFKNTSNAVGADRVRAGDVGFSTVAQCGVDLHLTSGDFLEAQVYQSSGGSLNVDTGPSTFMSIFKIA